MAASFHQAPHMDPKLLLQRKLGSAWSSPELVALLQTRPGLLSDVLCIFRGLEQPVRLRILLSFLAFDEISVLPKDSVLAVLDEAAADPDDWVKVMAAVVRDWLFGSAEGERPPSAEVAADVLAKCQVLEAAAAAADTAGDAQPAFMDVDGSLVVEPEPYFCPIEYLYLSEPVIQRHHRAAPLTRRENVHFTVGDLSQVEMEPILDTPLAAGAGVPHSSSSNNLRSFQQQGGPFSSAGGGAPPVASYRPHPPPPQSSAPQAVACPRPPLRGPRGAASLLGAAQRLQEKPRLKVIKLDDVKVKTDHAKVAASNEALSLEFGTQPLQLDTKTASKLQQPAQSAAGTAVAAPAAEAPDAAKKRSAAEALAGLVASSASSAGAAQALAPGAAASVDPLSDYHRMKAKSNRLTPQDDERIRLFYLHGTQGNPHPEQREVKIKINEEEVTKDDGSRVKETLYIALNYDTRKAVLSRKVSKPKTAAP